MWSFLAEQCFSSCKTQMGCLKTLSCRVFFSKKRPKTVHFGKAPRGSWSHWPMDHTLVARHRKPKIRPIEDVEGLPNWHSSKEPACQCRRHKRWGFSSWIWKIPGIGNDCPFQYSCLENPTDRGAWRATVHGVTKSQTLLSWSTIEDVWKHWSSLKSRFPLPSWWISA